MSFHDVLMLTHTTYNASLWRMRWYICHNIFFLYLLDSDWLRTVRINPYNCHSKQAQTTYDCRNTSYRGRFLIKIC